MAKTCTGAEALVRELGANRMSVCFANPGTTEMHLVAALEKSAHSIHSVLCLHETVASGAADGWARMRRFPGTTRAAAHPLGSVVKNF